MQKTIGFNFSKWKSKENDEQKLDKMYKTEDYNTLETKPTLETKHTFTAEFIDEKSKKGTSIHDKGSQRDLLNYKQPSKWSKLNLMIKKPSKAQTEFGNSESNLTVGNNLNYLINCKVEDFEFVGKTLGEGGFAVVRMAYYRKNKDKYAIKTFNRLKLTSHSMLKAIKQEYELMRDIDHHNVIKYYNYFENVRHCH